jgi:outer membrane protein assembly factor BamB
LADDLDLYLREHHGGTDSDGFRYYIFSVNAKTGALNWKHETRGVDRIVAAIANMVYLGTDRDSLAQIQRWAENLATAGRPRKNLPDWKHKVQALDLSSGRLLWALQGAQFLVATEKLAYVQLEDGSVVAADSANGKIRYRYTYGGVR